MTTPSNHPAAVLTGLALAMGEVQDRGGDAPAALRSAVVALGLSEEDQALLADVTLVAHGLLAGHDAVKGLVELWGPTQATAAAELALHLLTGLDGLPLG